MELYYKLGWPEYQQYQDKPFFDDHANYDPIEDVWFVEKKFLDEIIKETI